RSSAASAALLLGYAGPAFAGAADDAISDAQRAIGQAGQGVSSIEQAVSSSKADERSAGARIAGGELLLRNKDYAHASGVFNQVVEKYPNHPTAYPDALFLLGQTYYESKQYLSARRVYRQIVDRGQDPRFATYQGKALAGLIDVALRTRDYATLDDVFAKMNQ